MLRMALKYLFFNEKELHIHHTIQVAQLQILKSSEIYIKVDLKQLI